MNNLTIKASKYTPEIDMNADSGIISMTGKSYPENTFEFYQPVIDWLEVYFAGNAQAKTQVNLEIIYFNSSSSKFFFDFFDVLDEQKDKHKIVIHWIYDEENESALDAGEDFNEDFDDLTINLVKKA
jgi:SiaC family regulatory phosphoprotein